jgi:DNA mismatch endonuclease, patch repair protein
MDRLTPEERSQNMSRIRNKNTRPEKIVRSLLHRLGFRFRLHRRDLPGTPDIVLPGRKAVIFVHGCFWHQHKGCKDSGIPKSNIEFWETKLNKNVERDKRNADALKQLGWKVLEIWECETENLVSLAERLYIALSHAKD